MNSLPHSTIVIADKNPVIRTGLEEILSRGGRFQVIGTVSTGGALLELLPQASAEIAIIGWQLPDGNGGDVLAEIKRRKISVRPIIYTGEQDIDVLRRTIKLGAWGFMSKSDEPDVLLEAISTVSHGRVSFPFVDIESVARDPLDVLTVRERELLAALADGWTNQQIAARIGISRNTVKYHLKNLYEKLDVNNRAMAVALFMSRHTRHLQR